ncbi:shikimate dehydrogenase family protein [Glutamicibacter sp. AOP5-A2-18]|uniref:shikimate dehydrogenase family protein n=1 Tax=Glutamicibacter sp. AOP5-A2-18 TaxID=3457656 RepID=UPI004034A6BC
MNRPEKTTQLFIIGSHASTTMSPNLWNPVFEALGNGWNYQPWDVPTGSEMQPTRDGLLDPTVIAANVTMPHKQWAASAADTCTEQVALSGAANLLIRNNGQLDAYNTDISAVEEKLATKTHQHVLLLGAGGAARAALIALKEHITEVTITDQDIEVAQQLLDLATRMGISGTVVDWSAASQVATKASLIINATPIGKYPEDGAAWGTTTLSPGSYVYDFVYAEHTTGTIKAAIAQGLEYTDGWEHLLLQAAAMVPLLELPEQTVAELRESLSGIRENQ